MTFGCTKSLRENSCTCVLGASAPAGLCVWAECPPPSAGLSRSARALESSPSRHNANPETTAYAIFKLLHLDAEGHAQAVAIGYSDGTVTSAAVLTEQPGMNREIRADTR